MNCPKCKKTETHVYNSRKRYEHGGSVWRRRICLNTKCNHVWTTYEIQQEYLDRLIPLEKDDYETFAKYVDIIQKIHEFTHRKKATEVYDEAIIARANGWASGELPDLDDDE